MNKYSVSIVFAVFCSVAGAQEEVPARSIMFEEQPSGFEHLTTLPEGQRQDKGDRCMELLRKADELKGKPQRRSAAMDRYRQECELR